MSLFLSIKNTRGGGWDPIDCSVKIDKKGRSHGGAFASEINKSKLHIPGPDRKTKCHKVHIERK